MDSIILDHVIFDAPLEMFTERMRIQRRPAAVREVGELLEQAKPIARPKVMFKEAAISEKGESYVAVEDQRFHSSDLRQTVASLNRVFPTIVTCGSELAAWAEGVDGLFARFCAEAICEAAMISAQNELTRYLAENHNAHGISYILPGTMDWPIEEQKKIFALVGDSSQIGVILTPQKTMRPIKSVSALYYETVD